MKLSIKEILEATGGELISGGDPLVEVEISTDTRTIKENDIYLPLSGENFDGHNFIENTVQKGCVGYFTEKTKYYGQNAGFVIAVDDTLEAYLKTANYVRKKLNPIVIAITGSSGKTTVKEFIYSVLATSFQVHKSILNHNNEIGLCQTLLNMDEAAQFAVIEMGMRGLGEIELLSKHAEPDVAVITNIGTAHIGKLGSLENIAKAKCEITSHLKNSGTLLAFDDDLIKKYCSWGGNKVFYGKNYEVAEQNENSTAFMYKNEYYEIPVTGEYNVINAISAIEIGKHFGISYENILAGLLNYKPVGNRGKTISLKNGTKMIVDCYNANPDSMIASIDSIAKIYKNSKISLILGDMGELGDYEEDLHKKVGVFISRLSIDSLVTVGEKAKLIAIEAQKSAIKTNSFMDNIETAEFLANNLEQNSILFFKGSRSMKLEEIAESLQNSFVK